MGIKIKSIVKLQTVMPYLLEMNPAQTGLLFFFIYLAGFIIFMACLRWAVRANDITRNQQAIIWFMILQCKKQGATDEEIKKIKDAFNIP